MHTDLIADEIVKRVINADTKARIINSIFNPVTVPLRAIQGPLRDMVKASCPVSVKAKMLKEVEQAVIASLKNYGIRVSKK